MNFKNVKSIVLFLLYICIFSGMTSCKGNIEPIKIGVVGTMSGANSDLTVSGRRGVELAVDEFNKAGGLNGRKVELVVKDVKHDPIVAFNAYKEFIKEKIPVVIGPYNSGMIVSSMDYLKDKDILFLAPTVSADTLSDLDDNFIRFIATTKEEAVVLSNMARKNQNRKFAIIYDLENRGFNDALYTNFIKLLENNNGKVVMTKTFSPSLNFDRQAMARDIAESNADAVLIIADSSDNARITQQLRKIGCGIQIYAPLRANTYDLKREGGTAIEGMYIVGAVDLNDRSEDFVRFKENFYGRYEENPTYSSIYSYEAANALFQAMKMGTDLKPSTLKANIIKIKDFKGLQGNYQINEFGDNIRKYMIFRFENGELRKVD